jgi:predicted transcriptional regulator
MLLFLYSEGLFKKTDLLEYSNIFAFDKNRLKKLIDDGWVHMWAKKVSGNNQYYEVTNKCKKMITSFYKKLRGEEEYSTDPIHNPMFSKTASYSDKVFALQIKKINEYVKT